MANIETTNNNMLTRMQAKGTLYSTGSNVSLTTMEISLKFSPKTTNITSYNSAIPFMGMYSKESESACNRNACTDMFIASLLPTAKQWDQLR
jgi:hypothetical protein